MDEKRYTTIRVSAENWKKLTEYKQIGQDLDQALTDFFRMYDELKKKNPEVG
jgi:hypothetical protein